MLKKLIKESFIYGLSGYFSKFIGVFLLPLYTSVLTPSDYGILDLLNSVAVFSSFIIISGTDSALGYYYFRREFQSEKNLIVSAGLLIRIFFSFSIAILLFILSSYISGVLFHNPESAYLVQLYAGYIFFNSIFFFITELLRFNMKPWIYTIFSTGNVLVNILSAILFVLILRYGVTGAILASVISYCIFAVAGIIYILKNYKMQFSAKWMKNILGYGFPLIGTAIATWFLNYSDRYFLNYLSGLNQIGIYSVGLKVAAIMGMLSGAFQMSWGPFAADIQYEPNARNIYAKIFQAYFVVNIIIVFVVSLFAGEILKVLTQPAYYSAVFVIPLLCFSSVFAGAYFIAAAGINLTKKLQHTIWITVVAAVVNILMNFILTPILLSIGSAIAILSANFVIFLLTLIISQKYYRIEYKYGFIIALMLASTVIIWLCNFYKASLMMKILLSLIYIILTAFYIYKSYKDSPEFKKIIEMFKRFRSKGTKNGIKPPEDYSTPEEII